MSDIDPAARAGVSALPPAPLYRQLIGGEIAISELKTRRIEGTRTEIPIAADANIYKHFRAMRPGFAGQPELCFLHAQLVVCIRRNREMDKTLPAFLSLWQAEAPFLAANLSSRWLISACDTFADHGTIEQQAAAMSLAVFVNIAKLGETARLVAADSDFVPEKIAALTESHRRQIHVEFWDEVSAYSPYIGDMPRNLIRRMLKLADRDPAFSHIARALIARAAEADTFVGRFARMNPGFLPAEMHPPVGSPPLAPES